MNRTFFIASLMLLASTAMAQQTSFGIAGGQPGSTTFEMVSDITKVCGGRVVKSEGSLDNIAKISSDKQVQAGYSQEDALVYMQGQDPKMMERITMVFPLITAEIHLIVSDRSNIRNLSDLAGKRVIESEEGTGTWVTAQVIKKMTGINWQPLNMNKVDSLKAVQTGQADAAFYVEGRPVSILAKATGIRLIPLSNSQLDNFKYYTRTLIPSNTYPFQPSSVSTYKINIVLMTYAFKYQYQKEIGDLVTCIVRNHARLENEGHAKWREVDPLSIDSIAWQAHPAAVAAIKRETAGRKK